MKQEEKRGKMKQRNVMGKERKRKEKEKRGR